MAFLQDTGAKLVFSMSPDTFISSFKIPFPTFFAIILPSYLGDFNNMVTNVTKLSSELLMLVIVFLNFDNVSLIAEVVLQMRAVQNPVNTIKGVKRGFQ